jgi:hypothetical protein
MSVLPFFILIFDVMFILVIPNFFQTIYSLKYVPWAMPTLKEYLLNEVAYYLFAVSMAIDPNTSIVHYIQGLATMFNLFIFYFCVTYYSKI